jgi:hypothetical protein
MMMMNRLLFILFLFLWLLFPFSSFVQATSNAAICGLEGSAPPRVYGYNIIEQASFISPNVTYAQILVNTTNTTVFSLNFNDTALVVQDSSVNNLTVNIGNLTTYPVLRTPDRGTILSEYLATTWTSVISSTHLNTQTGWTLIFWISAPISNTASYTIIPSLLAYPWMIISNGMGIVLDPNSLSVDYINGWTMISLVYNVGSKTLAFYWNTEVLITQNTTYTPLSIPSPFVLQPNFGGVYLDNVTLLIGPMTNEYITQVYNYTLGLTSYQTINVATNEAGFIINNLNVGLTHPVRAASTMGECWTNYPTNPTCMNEAGDLHCNCFNSQSNPFCAACSGYNYYAEPVTVVSTPFLGEYWNIPNLVCTEVDSCGACTFYENPSQCTTSYFPGCVEHTTTMFVSLNYSVLGQWGAQNIYGGINQLGNVGFYDNLLNAFSNHIVFMGCGLNVWSYNVLGIEPNKKTHVAITYQNDRNDWYIDGVHVFSWHAYSIPEPKPFIDGILQVAPLHGVSIASTNFYCSRLTEAQILNDMSSFDTPDPKITTYDVNNDLPELTPMPEWENPFLYDVSYLAAYYCTFPDPDTFGNRDNVTDIIAPNYIHYYVNQANGSNNNNGSTPALALQTPIGFDWLRSMLLSYPILSEETMWDSLIQWGGLNSTIPWCGSGSSNCVPATFVPNMFGVNNQCNAWYFNAGTTAGTVGLQFEPNFPTACGYHVDGFQGGPTLSFWIQVTGPVVGLVNLGPSNQQTGTYIITITAGLLPYSYPNGTVSRTVYTLFACGDYSIYKNGMVPFNQACTNVTLNVNEKYHIITSTYIMEYSQSGIWVNGVLSTSSLADGGGTGLGYVYPGTYILNVNSNNYFTGYLGGMVLSCNGFQYAQTGRFLYNYVSTTNSCILANDLCVDIEMCYGDRYFGNPPLQIDVGNPSCPIIIKGIDCTPDDPSDDVYPLLSGFGLLPQTQDIGWEILSPFISLTGIEWEGVLRYPLHTLYTLQPPSLPYLNMDPLTTSTEFNGFTNFFGVWEFGFQPNVRGTLYNTPVGPNIDTPLVPFGRFMNQSLVVTGVSGSDFSQTFYTLYTNLTAGSWCFFTYHQMFRDNATAFYDFWINKTTGNITEQGSVFLNGAIGQGLSFGYQSFQFPAEATWTHGGGFFDCPTWYEKVYNLSDPYSPWISWNDSQIMIMDRLFSQVDQVNFTIPHSIPSATPGQSCCAFNPAGNAYGSWILGYLQSAGPPLLAPNPAAMWEGYISSNNGTLGMRLQDHIIMFDSPGEFYYDTEEGYLYLFPWNEDHRTGLLTVSDYYLANVTQILRDHVTTANWATVHMYNQPTAIASASVNGAYRQIQELEISGYGFYNPGPQESNWTLVFSGNGGVRLQNMSIHHVTAGIDINVGNLVVIPTHSYIVNTTVLNMTLVAGRFMFSGIQPPLGGCWGGTASGDGIVSIFNSTCFFGSGGTGNNFWSYGRDINMIHNYGESVWVDNSPFMNERMLVNQTLMMYVGDGGDDYGPANQWVSKYTTWDGPYHSWTNQINWAAAMYKQVGGGDTRIMYYEDTSGWYMHANKFLNGYGDGNGLYDSHGYQSISGPDWTSEGLFQATSCIWQRGQLRFFYGNLTNDRDPNMIFPSSYEATLGRPYGFWSNFAYYDGFLVGETTPYDYPVHWAMYQGYSNMWTWNTQFDNPAGCIWNFTVGYGLLNYTGLSNLTDYDDFNANLLSLEPGAPPEMLADLWTQTIIDNAATDVFLVLANDSPFPLFGFEETLAAAEIWYEGIDNEAETNKQLTEPTIWHIMMSQTPYWFQPKSIPDPGAQMWWDAYFAFTATSDYPFLVNISYNDCTGNNNDCASSLLFNYGVDYLTGQAQDSIFNNSLIECVLQASPISNPNPFGTFYGGVSYDPVFGAVIDSTRGANKELCYWNNFIPSLVNSYTITFWFYQPGFSYGINGAPNNCASGSGCSGASVLFNSLVQPTCTGVFYSEVYVSGLGCTTSPLTTTYSNNTVGVWTHMAFAQNPVTGFSTSWINGVYQLNAALSSATPTALVPLGVEGGANEIFTLLNKYAQFKVYAGVLSNATVMNLYLNSQNIYNGPSYTSMTSNTIVFQLLYQSSTKQFVNGISAYPYVIGGMGPFINNENNVVNMSIADPAGIYASNIPIINAYTPFTLPTPIMKNWQLNMTVQFLGIPLYSACYSAFFGFLGATSLHFFSTEFTSTGSTNFSSNPLAVTFVPDFAHSCNLNHGAANNIFYYVCILGGLYQPRSPTGVAPIYNSSVCSTGKFVLIANAWYNMSFQFNSYTSQATFIYTNSTTMTPISYTMSLPYSSYLVSTKSLSFARPPDYASPNGENNPGILSYCAVPVVIGNDGINQCYGACSSCTSAPNVVFAQTYYQNITITNIS